MEGGERGEGWREGERERGRRKGGLGGRESDMERERGTMKKQKDRGKRKMCRAVENILASKRSIVHYPLTSTRVSKRCSSGSSSHN